MLLVICFAVVMRQLQLFAADAAVAQAGIHAIASMSDGDVTLQDAFAACEGCKGWCFVCVSGCSLVGQILSISITVWLSNWFCTSMSLIA